MKLPPVLALLPSTLLFAAATVLPWLAGPYFGKAWSPGGLDAPEPPLIDLAPLWVIAAILLAAALLEAIRKRPAWLFMARGELIACTLIAAAYLVLTHLLAIPEVSVIALVALLPSLLRLLRRLAQARPHLPDRSQDFADMSAGILAGALVLSLAAWSPHLVRSAAGLGPSDSPWFSFWVFYINAVLLSLGALRRLPRKRWFLLALGWGIAATFWHNWAVSGLHGVALMTLFLSALLLARVTRRPKHPKPEP